MELKRCTSTEHLWNRKLVSLTSPVFSDIFLLIIIIIIIIIIINHIDEISGTPEGASMLTTGTLLRVMVWTMAAKSLLIGGSKPIPKMASTTRLYESATS